MYSKNQIGKWSIVYTLYALLLQLRPVLTSRRRIRSLFDLNDLRGHTGFMHTFLDHFEPHLYRIVVST